jgi:hypothetical protein
MIRTLLLLTLGSLLGAPLATPVQAMEKPPLPQAARQLKMEEIRSLYEGRTFAFENYGEQGPVIGLTRFDLAGGRNAGRYRIGSVVSTFESRVRFQSDMICYTAPSQPEECNSVFIVGQDVFEVGADGRVTTVIFLE